jgi:2-polyprenyl-6-methoxyphenol hydroxylase-like FAD-dependent oxidoreductase
LYVSKGLARINSQVRDSSAIDHDAVRYSDLAAAIVIALENTIIGSVKEDLSAERFMTHRQSRAVVLGASIAGLLAGRVLADFFDEVILIDKGDLDDAALPRKSVPQGNHAHAVLTPMYRVLQRFLPGLVDELVADGATVYDAGKQVRLLFMGKPLTNGRTWQPIIGSSRPLFENHLRRRVGKLKNIKIYSGCRFQTWLTDAQRCCVTGVSVSGRTGDVEISADLIIDARGRGSRLPAELTSLGFDTPRIDRVRVDLGYTSRIYRAPGYVPEWNLLHMNAVPPEIWKGGMISRIEDDMWVVTQFGYFGDHAPADERGFSGFAESLDAPDISDFLRRAQPVSGFRKYGMRDCEFLHVDRLDRFPERLLAVGDTVCSLNPVYGQGMTKAAIEAAKLWDELASHLVSNNTLNGFSDRFRRCLPDAAAASAWRMTTGADLCFAQTRGRRRVGDEIRVQYVKRILLRATKDLNARSRMLDVTMLCKSPRSLLNPRMMLYAAGI